MAVPIGEQGTPLQVSLEMYEALSKAKQVSTVYHLLLNTVVITKREDGLYPAQLTPSAIAVDTANGAADYAGRFVIETTVDGFKWTTQYVSESDEITCTYTPQAGMSQVRVTLYSAGGTVNALDSQTCVITSSNAEDGLTLVLSNESHTFAGTSVAAMAASTTCRVYAYRGATPVAASIGNITGTITGMTTSVSNNGTTEAAFTVTVTTALTANSGTLTVPITVGGVVYTKTFSWSVSHAGTKGDTGSPGAQGRPGYDGTDGESYTLVVNSGKVTKNLAETSFSPSALTATAYRKSGTSSQSTYYGYIYAQYSTNGGSSWYDISGTSGSSKTIYPSSYSSANLIKFTLYTSSSMVSPLASVTVDVGYDDAALKAISAEQNGTYYIDGGAFTAATINGMSGTFKQLFVKELMAQTITATGSLSLSSGSYYGADAATIDYTGIHLNYSAAKDVSDSSAGSYGFHFDNIYTGRSKRVGLKASGNLHCYGVYTDKILSSHQNRNNSYGYYIDVSDTICYTTSYTTSSSDSLRITASGYLAKPASSNARIKDNISYDLDECFDAHRLRNLKQAQWIYKEGYLVKDDELCGKTTSGFIADDVEKIFPDAVYHDDEGMVKDWKEKPIIAAHHTLICEALDRIDKIEKILEAQNG